MGYESRLYVVNRFVASNWNNYVFAERIAQFDMCCVGWNPDKVFIEPIDFSLFTTMTETETLCTMISTERDATWLL